MRKKLLKKSEVLREGFIKGLCEAKRIIGEATETRGRIFLAKNTEIETVEDDWERGEMWGTGTTWAGSLADIKFSTPEEFIEKLQNQVSGDIDQNSIWVDADSEHGRILVSFTGDANGSELSDSKMQLWKRGKFKAYTWKYEFEISILEENISDILINEFGWEG